MVPTMRVTVIDLRAQAQKPLDSGGMPSLDEVLKAVFEARRKYVPRILAARLESNHDEPKRV